MFLESYLIGSSWTIPGEPVSRNRRVSSDQSILLLVHGISCLAKKSRLSFRRQFKRSKCIHVFFHVRRSSCCSNENDFSREIFENLSAIRSDERFFVSFPRSRKTDRSTVLSFSLFFFFVTFHRYLEQIENTTEHIARD